MSAETPVERTSPVTVSIVVPTHARPELLERLLDSLHAQSYSHQHLQVIVIPTARDAGIDVVGRFRERTDLSIICEELPDDPSRGRSASAKRNHGAALASGAWLAFIDDDCVADPEWITRASVWFADPAVAAIEGSTEIPAPPQQTLTWKGLRALSRRGGYQTCNMLYRRERFLEVGGFDPGFPFYFEDTDLAWTVLDRGWQIVFAADARVMHPTPRPAPWRLLDDARRVLLLPALYRKHPERYRDEGRRALRTSHWIYLASYALLLACIVVEGPRATAPAAGAIAAIVVADAIRLFSGCRVELAEVVVITALLPIVPLVRGVQLVRGNVRQRVWLWT